MPRSVFRRGSNRVTTRLKRALIKSFTSAPSDYRPVITHLRNGENSPFPVEDFAYEFSNTAQQVAAHPEHAVSTSVLPTVTAFSPVQVSSPSPVPSLPDYPLRRSSLDQTTSRLGRESTFPGLNSASKLMNANTLDFAKEIDAFLALDNEAWSWLVGDLNLPEINLKDFHLPDLFKSICITSVRSPHDTVEAKSELFNLHATVVEVDGRECVDLPGNESNGCALYAGISHDGSRSYMLHIWQPLIDTSTCQADYLLSAQVDLTRYIRQAAVDEYGKDRGATLTSGQKPLGKHGHQTQRVRSADVRSKLHTMDEYPNQENVNGFDDTSPATQARMTTKKRLRKSPPKRRTYSNIPRAPNSPSPLGRRASPSADSALREEDQSDDHLKQPTETQLRILSLIRTICALHRTYFIVGSKPAIFAPIPTQPRHANRILYISQSMVSSSTVHAKDLSLLASLTSTRQPQQLALDWGEKEKTPPRHYSVPITTLNRQSLGLADFRERRPPMQPREGSREQKMLYGVPVTLWEDPQVKWMVFFAVGVAEKGLWGA